MVTSIISSIFTEELWNRNSDPRIKDFSIVGDTFPWKLITLCLIYFAAIRYWRPKISFSLKPWLLILNGTAFGLHGAGFFVCLAISSLGKDGLTCDSLQQNYTSRDFFDNNWMKSESTLRLAVVFLFIRISLFLESMILVLIQDRSISNRRLLNELMIIALAFVGVKYLAGGPALFFAQCYLAFYTYQYGYFTLKTGYQVSDSDLVLTSKKVSIFLQFLWSLAALYHPYYIVSQPQCTNGIVPTLMALEFIYGIGLMLNSFNAIKSLSSRPIKKNQ